MGMCQEYIDGLVQGCSNSSGLAVELLQSCTKSSIWSAEYVPENCEVEYVMQQVYP